MAGDWIKITMSLLTDPAVIGMAKRLNMSEDEVLGKLLKFWCWADIQTTTGKLPDVTPEWVDDYVRCEGFAKALFQANWLREKDYGLFIPKFKKHNGESAKQRANTAKRVAKHRAKQQESSNAPSVTREEKRRGEKRRKPTTPPSPPNDSAVQPLPSSARWNQVVEELIKIGIVDPHPAVEAARSAGATPEMVDEIRRHSQGKPGAWGLGAVRNRVTNARPGFPVDQGWPPPSEDYERGRRAVLEGKEKQAQQAKQAEEKQRRNEDKRIADERERLWGPKLDGMDQSDRDQLAVAALGETGPPIQQYRKSGATGIARLQMLATLAEEDGRR